MGLKKKLEADPSVFNFYVYLRTHPLIQRHNLTNKKLERGSSLDHHDKDTQFEDTVTPLERKLYFSTAHFHLRAGCPALAVEVLTKLPNKVKESKNEATKNTIDSDDAKCKKLETGTFDQSETMDWLDNSVKSKKTDEIMDWSKPEKTESEELVLDWGQPSSVEKLGNDEDELKLEWSDDPDSEDEEELKGVAGKLSRHGSTKKKNIQDS